MHKVCLIGIGADADLTRWADFSLTRDPPMNASSVHDRHCQRKLVTTTSEPTNQHHIAVVDACFTHGGATHTHQVRRYWVLDQNYGEVDTLAGVVFGWRWESSLDRIED